MLGIPLVISAALTTGSVLGAGNDYLTASPNAHAMTVALMVASLVMSACAAYRAATGPVRPPPPSGPSLPRLRRRLSARQRT